MQTATATATATSAPPIDFAALPRLERCKRAALALGKVLANPDDTEHVLEFLAMLNAGRWNDARIARFFADPSGEALYAQHRAIDSRTDLDALAALPEGTLGRAYVTFLRSHGLTPQVFDGAPVGFTEPRPSYVVQRMRQTHDLWHVVTGCETDPAGEIALQAFTFAQSRTPGNAVLALAGVLRGVRQKPGIVRDVVALFRAGVRARPLPSFAWEDHWDKPLSEVRAMLGLPIEPPVRAAA